MTDAVEAAPIGSWSVTESPSGGEPRPGVNLRTMTTTSEKAIQKPISPAPDTPCTRVASCECYTRKRSSCVPLPNVLVANAAGCLPFSEIIGAKLRAFNFSRVRFEP